MEETRLSREALGNTAKSAALLYQNVRKATNDEVWQGYAAISGPLARASKNLAYLDKVASDPRSVKYVSPINCWRLLRAFNIYRARRKESKMLGKADSDALNQMYVAVERALSDPHVNVVADVKAFAANLENEPWLTAAKSAGEGVSRIHDFLAEYSTFMKGTGIRKDRI